MNTARTPLLHKILTINILTLFISSVFIQNLKKLSDNNNKFKN